jgi:aminoglycoside phosphotransferase
MTSDHIQDLPIANNVQHGRTENLAINDTFINRFLVLLALKTTARFYSWMSVCVPITRNKIVKTGPYVHLTEGATMQFIAKNTSIPVPKVYCSFVRKNRAYIVMERIPGDMIPTAWKKLSEESRQKVFDQLKHMIQEMRSLKPLPGTEVESCVGGSLRDSRIPRTSPRFGPFKTVQDFHLWLREGLQPSQVEGRANDPVWEEVRDMAAAQDNPWPPPVFTHADLNPFNILVRGDRVVGLIDWELSGWYPHYWEYTSAWLSSVTRTEWQGSIERFLEPFPQELKMEAIRQKW